MYHNNTLLSVNFDIYTSILRKFAFICILKRCLSSDKNLPALSLPSINNSQYCLNTFLVLYKYILSLIGFGRIYHSRQISHWRLSKRCEEKSILSKTFSSITCFSGIWQGNTHLNIKINDNFSYHGCHLKIDIIECKDQTESLQIVDND